MIFITVGTQLPFDRMIRTVDEWAESRGRSDVFAQIGPAQWRPRHIEAVDFLDAEACRRKIEEASAVVAHAGMGSILTALELGKPIVVMPRRSDLGEHRNDHQMATARRFLAQGRIVVAFDEAHLMEKLDQLENLRAGERISKKASPQLLTAIRSFVDGDSPAEALKRAESVADETKIAAAMPLRHKPVAAGAVTERAI